MKQKRPAHIHVTVAAIIEQQGKFLLVEEYDPDLAADDTKQTFFNQPAGHVENNETIIEAVVRETLEETARQFVPLFATGVYRWQHPNGNIYLRHCFYGEVTHHDEQRSLDAGIVATRWLTHDEIKQSRQRHRSPLVTRCIEDYLSGQRYALDLYHNC